MCAHSPEVGTTKKGSLGHVVGTASAAATLSLSLLAEPSFAELNKYEAATEGEVPLTTNEKLRITDFSPLSRCFLR